MIRTLLALLLLCAPAAAQVVTPAPGVPASGGTFTGPVNFAGGVTSNIAPQATVFTSSSGTYTTPAKTLYLEVFAKGPGSGGAGSGTSPGVVSAPASDTTFGTSLITASAAGVPTTITGGAGGAATGGSINLAGQAGQTVVSYTFAPGGKGGGGGGGGSASGIFGQNASSNSGGGGGGAGVNGTPPPGGGGGEGGYVYAIIPTPAATYSYNVGPGSAGGTAGGSGGSAGGNGAAGLLTIIAHFQ